MIVLRPERLRIAAACLTLAIAAGIAHADPNFALDAPALAAGSFVMTDTVIVHVTAQSPGLLKQIVLTRNGEDVTGALATDAGGRSASGIVSGLDVGANTFLLSRTHGHDDPVARLVVERATMPAVSCASLASLAGFPVQPSPVAGGTTITLAQLVPATTGANALPEHCMIQGILQTRTGLAGPPGTPAFTTAQQYGTRFEIRLPTVWNGRYMFQGGGGTEGSVPSATGSQTGTASFPELRNGYAVASQNGGHQTSQLPPTLPATPTSPSILQVNMFFPDALAVRDWAYNSIDATTQTAKYLIDAYYGRTPDKSYFVGCSTSGRQAMAMSQLFPAHYDGVIAGDPFYLPPDISLSETWGLEQIISVSPKDANGNPIYLQSFPLADQQLFTNAILAACDSKDGLVDGMIDDAAACKFDPATFVFPSTGPYGAIAPGQPLQCAGAKTATCLTPAQVVAVKKIAEGPRTSAGKAITSPDGTPLSGYPFDGGFMQPSGIPTRDIGTANSPPGNIGLGSGQLPLFWFTTPNPNYNPLRVNYDTDISLVTASSPAVNNSTDITTFLNRGGKLILYHGLSDSGPPWPYTLKYFKDVEARYRKQRDAADFMKLYLVPNMGHCGGNAATDRFDMLAPMVDWIENGVAPDDVIATGTNFSSTLGTLAGLPTTRSRPLCAYPKTLRYVGPAGGDIASADNYACQ
jgi:hypothetical protein